MKITLDSIISGFKSVTKLIANFDLIESELNDKVLYRDNPDGEPNQMENDLDMNGNRITNLPTATSNTDPVTYAQFQASSSVVQFTGTVVNSRLGSDAAGSTFTVSEYTPGSSNLQVYLNGVLAPVSTYTEPTSTTVLMNTAPVSDDEYTFIINSRQVDTATVPASSVTYTPTGGAATNADAHLKTVDSKIQAIVCVKDFGAIGDGVTDDTTAILAADATGKQYTVPTGIYLFEGANLVNIENMYAEKGVVFKNSKFTGNIQFDRSGHLIGLLHNHLEEKAVLSGVTPQITSGNIVAPPKSTANNNSDVDVIGLWYQDFGLDAIRDSAVGSNIWYSWQWAHTDAVVSVAPLANQGYQPKRHPKLGWYRGEDQNVLDWQCYWLSEAGLTSVVVQGRGTNTLLDTSTWQNTSDINNWIYKLCYTVPNAASIGIIPWVESGAFSGNFGNAAALAAIATAWDANTSALHESGRAKVVTNKGKRYISVYMFEGESLRGDFDNYSGSVNTEAFLASRATAAQSLGYDGICVLARNPTSEGTMPRGELLGNGVLYLGADYLDSTNDPLVPVTYENYVDAWTHDAGTYSLVGIHTDAESSNHPSDWTQSGSTPELFKEVFAKAVGHVKSNPEMPQMITIYNVSEWAEGGAGLQPSLGDGWGYLDAVNDVINASPKATETIGFNPEIFKPTASVDIERHPIVSISSDFNQTFNGFTPFLTSGIYEGQEITIVNNDILSAGHIITIPDDSITAGSNMFFTGGASKVLNPWESVTLIWFSSKGWIQK